MGFLSPEGESHVELIVFFLSEALRSAVETGDKLQQSVCDAPQIGPGMDCAEIADKLAGFRGCMSDLWNCELMMLTKILRARDLAKELRVHEPTMKPEIDTFRLATVMAADLRDALMPKAETLFCGAVHPKRFLEARGHRDVGAASPRDALMGYKVAGQLDVRLLLDACEALHFSLSTRYGFDAARLANLAQEAEAAVEQIDEELLLEEIDAEDPLLLSDWGEIISDSPAASNQLWKELETASRTLPH